ncbi:MAG: hypothetical protein MUE53_08065 [Chitinophagales bacterium]|jgi:hypothetical protein|nr:hypothetical protein [Chitinophagales bacterium]
MDALQTTQSLKVIEEMIEISKSKIIDDGRFFILWGVLIIIASFSQAALLLATDLTHQTNLVWMLLPVLGAPMSIWLGKQSTKHPATIVSSIYLQIWKGFGVALMFIIAISILYRISPTPFILILMAFAVYISGKILKFKPLIFGSVLFVLGAIGYKFLNHGAYQALMYGIVVLFGYVLPGYLLQLKSKKS